MRNEKKWERIFTVYLPVASEGKAAREDDAAFAEMVAALWPDADLQITTVTKQVKR